ncbi:unnamed protein product, partial [Protopolystoma xenopodis]
FRIKVFHPYGESTLRGGANPTHSARPQDSDSLTLTVQDIRLNISRVVQRSLRQVGLSNSSASTESDPGPLVNIDSEGCFEMPSVNDSGARNEEDRSRANFQSSLADNTATFSVRTTNTSNQTAPNFAHLNGLSGLDNLALHNEFRFSGD